ncbi:MAG: hypothetical protein KC646_10170 [Candidatus Cloacimonetes bacterium]|nr:hypothetical protein [Candidatus Cloacimonadota bacterium]
MKCDCIEKINKLTEKDNYMLKTKMYRVSDTEIVSRISLETVAIEKKRGFRPPSFFMTYCPFCGIKLED